jgi:hypothetical protein
MHSVAALGSYEQYSGGSLCIAAARTDGGHFLLCYLNFIHSFAMHPCAPTAREVLQQRIAGAAEFEQELKRTSRAVQKSRNDGKRRDRGCRADRKWVLLRLIADQSSMNPHAVLAARRLLPNDVWQDADTLAEQAIRLQPLIEKPVVHVAAARALAAVPWKITAVRAVRIIAELRLLRRIAEMNSRGVAPHSKMVAEMLVEEWPAHVLQPRITSWLSRLTLEPKLRRRWLVRLRRFWGVHYRKLGSRAHLSPADQRRKVFEHKH